MRRICHLDMDAFYASVELLRYPQLKGLPIVIGGSRNAQGRVPQSSADQPLSKIAVASFPRLAGYTGRGVITTATYAARQFGVGSAMGLMKAAKLCPEAILLPVDFPQYRHYSQAFKKIIVDIAPTMEDRGIDEVYIDFTDVPGGQREGGRVLARLIQKTIFEETGLTCSLGVAPNKLLAKMASEFNKPNGIAIIYEEDLESQIWPLACNKINGIGPKTSQKLDRYGIQTIGQLAQCDLNWLIDHFGQKTGMWMYASARGQDSRPVVVHSEPVSISRETTFERDLHAKRDRTALGEIFTQLCQQLEQDLERKGYVAKSIGVKVRFDDFSIMTRETTIEQPTRVASMIRQHAGLCLKRLPLQRAIRLLGVRASNLRLAEHKGTSAPEPRGGLGDKLYAPDPQLF